ncbi:hypothetical protein RIR_e451_jg29286.t1 [Rhizophagus irregularis DAOM 181602=DAOM 197198]|nr:hypothetical protein RIR_e451_jg29286.t1 [Rhizophagus irregularis DAOM 181602=DAOM 197198]
MTYWCGSIPPSEISNITSFSPGKFKMIL